MRAGPPPQHREIPGKRLVPLGQSPRPIVDGVQDVAILGHRAREQGRCFLGVLGRVRIRLVRDDRKKHAVMTRARTAEAAHGAKPPPVISATLPEKAAGADSDPPFDGNSALVPGRDIVVEAIFAPVNKSMRVIMVEPYAVDDLDVLHIGRVAGEYPAVARILFRDEIAHQLPLGRNVEFRKRPARGVTVECPHDPPPLLGGKGIETGDPRRRIADPGLHTHTGMVVFPVVKGALDVVADDLADRKVSPDMRAVSALYPDDAVFSSDHDHASVEEIAADHLP